jgi:hypothetical protein
VFWALRRQHHEEIAMNLRKFTIVPMFAMALFAVGCGPDCEGMCEERNECDGAMKQDCEKVCEDGEKEAEKAGCEDQYDDYLSCLDDQDDLCKMTESTCSKEFDALGKCAAH